MITRIKVVNAEEFVAKIIPLNFSREYLDKSVPATNERTSREEYNLFGQFIFRSFSKYSLN